MVDILNMHSTHTPLAKNLIYNKFPISNSKPVAEKVKKGMWECDRGGEMQTEGPSHYQLISQLTTHLLIFVYSSSQ